MGSPRIYWQPMGVGVLRVIDLDFLTEAPEQKDVRFGDVETLGGGLGRSVNGQWGRVTVERELLTPGANALLLRELRSLESHLIAGFPIGVAVDGDLAFLSWLATAPVQGSTGLNMPSGNHYVSWAPTVTAPTVGEEYVVHDLTPARREERHRCISFISPLLITDESISYSFPLGGQYLCRHRHFWPALKLHADSVSRGTILVDEGGGRSFTLLMDLREDLIELNRQRTGDVGSTEQAPSQQGAPPQGNDL